MTPKRLFDNLTKQRIHAKPIAPNSHIWFTESMTIWGSFVDDCMRFGVRTACANFWSDLTN